jgi:hypothetical protein
MIITDEMVKEALKAELAACVVDGQYTTIETMRAALEAVAPMLIAQGLREAVNILGEQTFSTQRILARAQELDQK